MGAVMAGWTVPMVAFMLLGGALADRMPRGLVLRGCNLVEAVAQTATAALVLTGYAEIWHLVVLQLVSGTASAVSYPAEHGMVPVLLPRELRQAGYLLMSQSRSATTIGGPALAGLLVATAGPGYALAIDAATFFVAAGFLTLMRLPPGERPDRQDSVLGDLRAGWSFARELGWVIPASSCALVFNALVIPALIPLALRGVRFQPASATELLRRHMLIYGVGGVLLPFAGIKLIDVVLSSLFTF